MLKHKVLIKRLVEDEDYYRCIEISSTTGSPYTLRLQILASDREATEFLTREQFEELVTNARRIMGWVV